MSSRVESIFFGVVKVHLIEEAPLRLDPVSYLPSHFTVISSHDCDMLSDRPLGSVISRSPRNSPIESVGLASDTTIVLSYTMLDMLICRYETIVLILGLVGGG